MGPSVGVLIWRSGVREEIVWLNGMWEWSGVEGWGVSHPRRNLGSEMGMEARGFVTDSVLALRFVCLY